MKRIRPLILVFMACAISVVSTSCAESSVGIAPVSNIVSADAININSADKSELQRIPFVGEKLAESIIEHRERFGPFRRPEHLLLIKGVSDKRFRQIRHLIRVD